MSANVEVYLLPFRWLGFLAKVKAVDFQEVKFADDLRKDLPLLFLVDGVVVWQIVWAMESNQVQAEKTCLYHSQPITNTLI